MDIVHQVMTHMLVSENQEATAISPVSRLYID